MPNQYLEELELFIRADESAHGVVVKTNDVERAANRLRTAKTHHPDYAHIEVGTSPYDPEGEVLLIRKGPANEQE